MLRSTWTPIEPHLDILVEQAGNSVPDLYIRALQLAAAYVTAKLSLRAVGRHVAGSPAMVVLRAKGHAAAIYAI